MLAEGGICAVIAQALVTHGCRLIDRSGYADAPADQVGTRPQAASLQFQAGAQLQRTNIKRLDIAVTDLRLVVG